MCQYWRTGLRQKCREKHWGVIDFHYISLTAWGQNYTGNGQCLYSLLDIRSMLCNAHYEVLLLDLACVSKDTRMSWAQPEWTLKRKCVHPLCFLSVSHFPWCLLLSIIHGVGIFPVVFLTRRGRILKQCAVVRSLTHCCVYVAIYWTESRCHFYLFFVAFYWM